MTTLTKNQKEHTTLPVSPNTKLPLAVAFTPKTNSETVTDEETLYSEDGLRVSEAVYWSDYYEHPDFNYEWNNGILEEKGMSNRPTYLLYMWFTQLLLEYLKYNPIAQTIGLETGGRIPLPHKIAIRKPDLGIVLHTNPVSYQGNDNTYKGIFDICIEAISKTKEKYKTKDTIDKKKEYALGGVKEYYILDGDGEETVFYRLNKQGKYERIKNKNGIIESKVLPSFQFRLSDLYTMPPIEELRHDDVYKHFVALNLQAADNKAKLEAKARQQEAKARQKAEAQAKAAEAEIERLKTLLKTIDKAS